MLEPLPYLACIGVATAALYTDTRRGIIPNVITLPAAAAGVLLGGLLGGWDGLALSLQGLGLGFALLLLPCLLGGTGGGDLKLLAAFGAFLGPAAIVPAFLYAALLGGAIALAILIRARGPLWFALAVGRGGFVGVIRASAGVGATFPFAGPLWAGVVLLVLMQALGR